MKKQTSRVPLILLMAFTALTACNLASKTSGRNPSSLGDGSISQTSGESNLAKLQKELSRTASLVQAGRNGRVTLFFMDKDELLNIVKCEPMSIIDEGLDCPPVEGSEKIKIDLDVFLGQVAALITSSYKSFIPSKPKKTPVGQGLRDEKRVSLSDMEKFNQIQSFVSRFNLDSISEEQKEFLERTEAALNSREVRRKQNEAQHHKAVREWKFLVRAEELQQLIKSTVEGLRSQITDSKIHDLLYEKDSEQTLLHGLLETMVYGFESQQQVAVLNEAQAKLTDRLVRQNKIKKKYRGKINTFNLDFEYVEIDEIFKDLSSILYDQAYKFTRLRGQKRLKYSRQVLRAVYSSKEDCARETYHLVRGANVREFGNIENQFCGSKRALEWRDGFARFAKAKSLPVNMGSCVENFDTFYSTMYIARACRRKAIVHRLNKGLLRDNLDSEDIVLSILTAADQNHTYRRPSFYEYLAANGVSGKILMLPSSDNKRLREMYKSGEELSSEGEYVFIKDESGYFKRLVSHDGSFYREKVGPNFGISGFKRVLIKEKRD